MTYGKALQCLSDPTRRRVFEKLRLGPQSVGVLARGLPVSRPAVSQHLKGLGELRRWLDQFWTAALESFKNEVAATHAAPGRKKP
jgi:hypothetical protein